MGAQNGYENPFVERHFARLAELIRSASPWMNAHEAAEYLRCPVSRIRKLTSTGEIPHHHDGRRVLFDRNELDQYVRNGGAIST